MFYSRYDDSEFNVSLPRELVVEVYGSTEADLNTAAEVTHVRLRSIFGGDRDTDKTAAAVSNAFEHGYELAGNLRADAVRIREPLAAYVRRAFSGLQACLVKLNRFLRPLGMSDHLMSARSVGS